MIQILSGFGLIATCVVSLVPIDLSNGWKTKLLYLPLLGTGLYAIYEACMPVGMNIRVDVALILPMLLFLWLNGVAKAGIMLALAARSGGDPQVMACYPQCRLQLAFTLPILLTCGAWFLRMWNP